MPAHRYLWALLLYASIGTVDADKDVPAHHYLWACIMYASIVNGDARRDMPANPYLWTFLMYASIVNVDVHRSPPAYFVNARRRQPLIGNRLARRFLITVDGYIDSLNQGHKTL